jgi:metallophosphoesterase (TIGR00282 family)
MSLSIAYVGEITGKAGVFALKSGLPELRNRYKPDFILACADSATGVAGLGVQHAVYLRKLGVDCLTVGDCAYYKPDMTEFYPRAGWVVRPANYPYDNPGRGWKYFKTGQGSLVVLSLLGQAGFARVHAENPFLTADHLLAKLSNECRTILVDFHAATTAEKLTMAAYLDGRVSAVLGSHAKALTADARLSPRGTAAITDCGRTGSIQSVGGMNPEAKVREYMTALRAWAGDGNLGLEIQGCVLRIADSGRAEAIESFRIPCKENIDERNGNDQGS